MLLSYERSTVRAVTRETVFVTRPDPRWLNLSTYAQAYGVDREAAVTLRDPDVCKCGQPGRLVKRRRGKGFLSRRHACDRCGHRWTSYQSLINPKKLRLMPVVMGSAGGPLRT